MRQMEAEAAAAPRGEVAVMFTDIESSSALWRASPSAMKQAGEGVVGSEVTSVLPPHDCDAVSVSTPPFPCDRDATTAVVTRPRTPVVRCEATSPLTPRLRRRFPRTACVIVWGWVVGQAVGR